MLLLPERLDDEVIAHWTVVPTELGKAVMRLAGIVIEKKRGLAMEEPLMSEMVSTLLVAVAVTVCVCATPPLVDDVANVTVPNPVLNWAYALPETVAVRVIVCVLVAEASLMKCIMTAVAAAPAVGVVVVC